LRISLNSSTERPMFSRKERSSLESFGCISALCGGFEPGAKDVDNNFQIKKKAQIIYHHI
jgi:hypothetical protein